MCATGELLGVTLALGNATEIGSRLAVEEAGLGTIKFSQDGGMGDWASRSGDWLFS